tara:strand:- start:23 stop:721 length:699 start_codon:yes stop_codon:yes gene_type:complete
LKLQITNLFFLSTVLLFISSCQELEQINLYSQSNLPSKSQKNQLATKVIIVKPKESISNRNEELRNFFKPYINMSSLKQKLNSKYSLKSKLTEIKNNINKSKIFIKPTYKVDFDIDDVRYNLSLKAKSSIYRNSVFTKNTFEVIELITAETIGFLNLTNMKLFLGENDYTRKHGKILTYQYRFDKCVLDLFFNENSNKLIFYDIRKRNYDGFLSIEKCLLEVNLKKIKLYKS